MAISVGCQWFASFTSVLPSSLDANYFHFSQTNRIVRWVKTKTTELVPVFHNNCASVRNSHDENKKVDLGVLVVTINRTTGRVSASKNRIRSEAVLELKLKLNQPVSLLIHTVGVDR